MGQYDHILGPLMLSVSINTYFSGIVGFQYASYHNLGFKDSWIVQMAVYGLCFIDLFQVAVGIYMAWIFCVENYINPSAMDNFAKWTYTIIPLCTAVSGAITHAFLANRIFDFTKRKVALTIAAFLTGITLAMGVFSGAYGLSQKISMIDVISESANVYRILIIAWLALQVVSDITISGNLGYIFHQHRATFMDHLPSRLNKVMDAVVQSNSLGTIFSLGALVTFLASPKTNAYLVFLLPLGRLYSASVLNTLLARDKRASMLPGAQNSSKGSWAVGGRNQGNQGQSFNLIRITTEQEIVIDGASELDHEKGSRPLSRASGGSGQEDEAQKIPGISFTS